MKKLVWLVGAMCAAAAGCLVLTSSRRIEPRMDPSGEQTGPHEDAWHERHTIA